MFSPGWTKSLASIPALIILCLITTKVQGFGCCIAWWVDPVQNIDVEIFFPLRSMDARAVIMDGIVEVSIVQYFETVTTAVLPELWQTKYQIPIDEEAAIHRFICSYDDRVIEGVVKSDEVAQKEFDDALQDGKPAFLGEQTSPGVFKIEFGNVPLEKVLKVELVYVAEVQSRDRDTLRFTIPASLAPELNPRGDNPQGVPFQDGVFTLRVEAFSSTPGGIVGASSPTHSVSVANITPTGDLQPGKRVDLRDTEIKRRDVIILFQTAAVQNGNHIFSVYQETLADKSAALMVSLFPDTSQFTDSSLLTEFIILIDRSGSMRGDKIRQTRTALAYFLENLPAGSRYNFVSFGTRFEYLFAESKDIEDVGARASANIFVNTLSANFGETAIFPPIESILKSQPAFGYQRVLIALTDGEVSDTNMVVDYVATNRGSTRCFTIGIGEADRELVNGIARSGGGTAEYVDSNELANIQEAMQNQVEIASQAGYLFIKNIEWGDLTAPAAGILAPYGLEVAFAERRTLIYLLTSVPKTGVATASIPSQVVITALIGGQQEIAFSIPRAQFIDSSKLRPGANLVSKMAAREAIRDLEEGRSAFHSEGNPNSQDIKKAIIDLGVKYQITSSETSFIAIDNFDWTSRNAITSEPPGSGGISAPSPAPPPSGGGFVICFSAENKVLVKDKGEIRMDALEIGDLVQVGPLMFSQVYSFGHMNDNTTADYLQLHYDASSTPLELSKNHMVFVHSEGAVPASKVTVGDKLVLVKEDEFGTVTKIVSVRRTGAYAPFTDSGTIVVSGVKASSYVSLQDGPGSFRIGGVDVASMHWLAHAYQAPHRLACGLGMCKTETYAESGISHWVNGPFTAFMWVFDQHPIVTVALSVFALCVGLTLYLVEVAAMNSLVVLVLVGSIICVRRNAIKIV